MLEERSQQLELAGAQLDRLALHGWPSACAGRASTLPPGGRAASSSPARRAGGRGPGPAAPRSGRAWPGSRRRRPPGPATLSAGSSRAVRMITGSPLAGSAQLAQHRHARRGPGGRGRGSRRSKSSSRASVRRPSAVRRHASSCSRSTAAPSRGTRPVAPRPRRSGSGSCGLPARSPDPVNCAPAPRVPNPELDHARRGPRRSPSRSRVRGPRRSTRGIARRAREALEDQLLVLRGRSPGPRRAPRAAPPPRRASCRSRSARLGRVWLDGVRRKVHHRLGEPLRVAADQADPRALQDPGTIAEQPRLVEDLLGRAGRGRAAPAAGSRGGRPGPAAAGRRRSGSSGRARPGSPRSPPGVRWDRRRASPDGRGSR